MKKNNLLTIKEFAKLAGVSQQAIYKQLNNRLNRYVQLVDNQKMLEFRALKEVYGVEFNEVNQLNQHSTDSTDFQLITEVLQATISTLQNQIYVKDKLIEELNSRLAESNAALVAAQQTAQAAQQTAQAAQALHAGTLQKQLIGDEVADEQSQEKSRWQFWKKKRK